MNVGAPTISRIKWHLPKIAFIHNAHTYMHGKVPKDLGMAGEYQINALHWNQRKQDCKDYRPRKWNISFYFGKEMPLFLYFC